MITELGPVADTSEHLVGVRGNAALRIEQSTAYRPPMLTSVQNSSTISYETPIYVILYVLRDVRTLFMYYF